MTTVLSCVMAVSEPTFVEQFRALAADNHVLARAVLDVANQATDGGHCLYYVYGFLRDNERHTLDLPMGKSPWEMIHFRVRDDVLAFQLSERVGGPATAERFLPLGQIAVVDLAPGYVLVVDTAHAPDYETARRWAVESSARRKAILRRYNTRTADGRSRAVQELLSLETTD